MGCMSDLGMIIKNAERLLKEIPEHVTLLAAVKSRTAAEVKAAYEGGIRFFGHNYVQEAQAMLEEVDFKAEWHMIGHLQRNKAKDAINLFDMIETLDSIKLAEELEKRCASADRIMDVLIEINSGAEDEKSGILPEELHSLAEATARMQHLHLCGLMTMGPLTDELESARPYFVKTRKLFDALKSSNLPGVDMQVLSMGMSGSYRVAIEEGSTLVRLGTAIFGPRY